MGETNFIVSFRWGRELLFFEGGGLYNHFSGRGEETAIKPFIYIAIIAIIAIQKYNAI